MSLLEQAGQVFTWTNMKFLLEGLGMTLFISVLAIFFSTIFGTILAVMRNSKSKLLNIISSIYIEVVRNIPNLLWIFVVFLIFQMKSIPAGVTSFTIFTSAALAEIIRGGLNGVPDGQVEAGKSQGFTEYQILTIIVLPQAIRKMLPAIISQFVTVIKDTSFLYSAIALQEFYGSSQILMGKYYQAGQVFMIYGILALTYFFINFLISQYSRKLSRSWASSLE